MYEIIKYIISAPALELLVVRGPLLGRLPHRIEFHEHVGMWSLQFKMLFNVYASQLDRVLLNNA